MKKNSKRNESTTRSPVFTYTTAPGSLRRILQAIPDNPIPQKVTSSIYKSWGIGDNNASNATRVLKTIGLLETSGQPTEMYAQFMQPSIGPAVLGEKIKEHYKPLFDATHEPYRASDPDLKRLFNIHSGGGESTLRAQVQTFKALCESATFGGVDTVTTQPPPQNGDPAVQQSVVSTQIGPSHPTVHIDLHIHLPENKSSRDYQAIIEDIAKYIYRYGERDDD